MGLSINTAIMYQLWCPSTLSNRSRLTIGNLTLKLSGKISLVTDVTHFRNGQTITYNTLTSSFNLTLRYENSYISRYAPIFMP
jgi:hypothetical protein